MPWSAAMTPCRILHHVTLTSGRSYAPTELQGTVPRSVEEGVQATRTVLHRVGQGRLENRSGSRPVIAQATAGRSRNSSNGGQLRTA
jgi:hypothetical protein